MTNRSIRFIQVFRGIAALLVVLWHASRYVGPYGTGTGAMLFQAGASMGVDLFFLISGFIMVYTTASNNGSFHYLMDFFVKRFTRIWPVWAIALVIYIAAKWDLSYLTDIPRLKWFLHSLAFIPTAGVSGDIAPVFGFPILGVGWTLNYEMYFYLFFGACMLFGRWRWPAMAVWLLVTLIGIPYVTGRLGGIDGWQAWLSPNTDYHYHPRYISLITNPLILMFAVGAAIAKLYQSSFVIESRFYLHLAMFRGGFGDLAVHVPAANRPWCSSMGPQPDTTHDGFLHRQQTHRDPGSQLAGLSWRHLVFPIPAARYGAGVIRSPCKNSRAGQDFYRVLCDRFEYGDCHRGGSTFAPLYRARALRISQTYLTGPDRFAQQT